MSEAFKLIEEGLEDIVEYERGKKKLRVHDIHIPEPSKAYRPNDFKRIRRKLGCSQGVFAAILNVSLKTIQAWELGARTPSHCAQRLLEIVDKGPNFLARLLPE